MFCIFDTHTQWRHEGRSRRVHLPLDLRIVFKPGRSLSGFFQFNDVIPKLMRSHVVYKYKCQCCGALYFGQTCCHLPTLISEHLGISPLSGKKLSCSSLSVIQVRTRTICHPISFEDFSIMSYCNSASDLLIKESLLISNFKPELNETIRSVPLALFWFISLFLLLLRVLTPSSFLIGFVLFYTM